MRYRSWVDYCTTSKPSLGYPLWSRVGWILYEWDFGFTLVGESLKGSRFLVFILDSKPLSFVSISRRVSPWMGWKGRIVQTVHVVISWESLSGLDSLKRAQLGVCSSDDLLFFLLWTLNTIGCTTVLFNIELWTKIVSMISVTRLPQFQIRNFQFQAGSLYHYFI